MKTQLGDDCALLASQRSESAISGKLVFGETWFLFQRGRRATFYSVKGCDIICQYEELQRLSVLVSMAITHRLAFALFVCLWLPVGFLLLVLWHELLGIRMVR